MKVQKFPQSHLVIVKSSTKIVIDPGNITFNQGYQPEKFQGASGYLITHQHSDHMDPANIRAVVGSSPVYGNFDVVAKLSELGVQATQVTDRQKFKIGELEIEAVDLPHCLMSDGTAGPPNTGFLVAGVLFHPGDGDKDPGNLEVANFALPIAGPSINFEGALKFAQDLGAKIVIPIHYDVFRADPKEFKRLASSLRIEVRLLSSGEETEV